MGESGDQPQAPAAPAAPAERNLAKETMDTLNAQRYSASSTADAEVTYRPVYAQLNSDLMRSELLGGKRVQKVQVGTDRVQKLNSEGKAVVDGAGNPVYEDKAIYGSQLVDDPTKVGLLDIYQNDLYPRLNEMQTRALTDQRTADITDVENLGGRAVKAFQNANPLVGKLNDMAMEQLQSGGKLTREEADAANQAVRAGMSDRGLILSNPAIFAEALNRDGLSNSRLAQREAFAQSVAGMNLDPVMAVLGRPANSTGGAASTAIGQASGLSNGSNQLFGMDQDQWASYASDLNSSNQNAEAAYTSALANYNSGIYASQMAARSGSQGAMLGMSGAALGGIGSIMSGMASGGMFS